MQIITAPSKTQTQVSPVVEDFSQPLFPEKTQELIDKLTYFSHAELSDLLRTSDKLTQSTHDKIHSFKRPFTLKNSRQAIFTFQGDAYSAIKAESYTIEQLLFAQDTLTILSGLYGILRPLDLMQPYRLEMGTKLHIGECKNLYQFWKADITPALNRTLCQHEDKTLINLASTEYAKVVVEKNLEGKLVSIVFKQRKNGLYKTVPIYSKRARGMMIHYIIVNGVKYSEELKDFGLDGYRYNQQTSTHKSWVFLKE